MQGGVPSDPYSCLFFDVLAKGDARTFGVEGRQAVRVLRLVSDFWTGPECFRPATRALGFSGRGAVGLPLFSACGGLFQRPFDEFLEYLIRRSYPKWDLAFSKNSQTR